MEYSKKVDHEVAVEKKFLNHLWYLNEANIGLSFFDDNSVECWGDKENGT